MKQYAVVGFGCAGYYAAKALREYCPDSQIDVYSDTDTGPANPMLTTYYVAGKIPRSAVFPFGGREKVEEELSLHFYERTPVARVLPGEKPEIVLADGTTRRYDDIVLASGSHPLVPPVTGMPKKGVYVMRTVEDADKMLAAIDAGAVSALVIGASWVGIKVIEALHAHGVPSTLADMAPHIFATAAMPDMAEMIHQRLRALGVSLLFGQGLSSMREEPDGIVCTFGNGQEIKSQIVALCLGLRPSVSYLEEGALQMGRGVQVDTHMRSSAEHIYAVGDCCETREIVSGNYMPVYLWANAALQGRIAGRNIAGFPDEFQGCLVHNITHFLDMDFIGLGNPRSPGTLADFSAPEKGVYIKAVLKDGKLQCANILENYRVSGALKSFFLRQQECPGEAMPETIRAELLLEGLNNDFIRMIGGNGL